MNKQVFPRYVCLLAFVISLSGCVPIVQENSCPDILGAVPSNFCGGEPLLVLPLFSCHQVSSSDSKWSFYLEEPSIISYQELNSLRPEFDRSTRAVFSAIGTVYGKESSIREVCLICHDSTMLSLREPDRGRWRERDVGKLTRSWRRRFMDLLKIDGDLSSLSSESKSVCKFHNGQASLDWSKESRENVLQFLRYLNP